MYASIRRYVVHPGSIDEIARQVNKGFLPIIRDIPGFVAYYVVDARHGTGISFSIFEGQAMTGVAAAVDQEQTLRRFDQHVGLIVFERKRRACTQEDQSHA